MKLTKVQITDYQSVRDSDEFDIGDITCLVGKNEAGKTAILRALYKLNPIVKTEGSYNVTDDYPRRDVEDYRLDVEQGVCTPSRVACAWFTLEAEDRKAISNVFGDHALTSDVLELSKGYGNTLYIELNLDESATLQYLISLKSFTPELLSALQACGTVTKMLETMVTAEQTEAIVELTTFLTAVQQQGGLTMYVYNVLLKARVPKFLYFDEYYQMEGRANIEALKQRQMSSQLKPSDHPLLGLISLSRLNIDELLNPTRTRDLKNKIEGASNHLTKKVVSYWSQNGHLQLRFDVRPAQSGDPEEMRTGTNIWGEVYDSRHSVTTELGTRSRGFVWFFSFLSWYSDVKKKKEPVILLLDEPGQTLHAKAQEDLLRFFEEEVKDSNQLIYTTHSPFMVDPSHFDRVRIVQDASIENDEELPPKKQGTKVLTEVLDASSDSLFPLQGALGYEVYQTLFVGPNSLVVEGASDLIYLQTMSALLHQKGRVSLNPLWTITPVGGSDKVPTFVALIGAQKKLNVAVLVDFQKKDQQLIENLYVRKLLAKKHVLTYADFTGGKEADLEDMFEPDFYLKIVNAEFKELPSPIRQIDLNDKLPRIIMRLEEYLKTNAIGVSLDNHFRPARYLSDNLTTLKGNLSDTTLERFEKAFKHLNALIK